ncbi:MAG: hypothetical protein KKD39_07285 [Candidatus Altiarchaeota archaeon]|nr:hypothetical protein [Candidatus Altiarchaeota archaeon]
MEYEEAIRMVGYGNIDDYFKRVVLPIFAVSIVFFILGLLLVNLYGALLDMGSSAIVLYLLPIMFLVFGAIAVLGYPYFGIERIKVNIHENIHYFITYAGALSTLHLPRKKLFRLAAQRMEYGHIARMMEKVAYLSDYWNLSLVTSCRKLSTLVP